jgi:hypothetical protein
VTQIFVPHSTGFRARCFPPAYPGIGWRRSAYATLPWKLRPSPLNLIFKSLEPGATRIDRAEVKFDAIDFDAY